MIEQLVVNGCSYMEVYAMGNGQQDLANRLNIKNSTSLAIGGSANSRIIRTTLKHSYQTTVPTLYVLGMTFLSRNEIPILTPDDEFEGMWTNPQNQQFADRWQNHWTQRDTERYVDLKLKAEWTSVPDRLEDLMYRIVSMASDLHQRGHRVLVYQQADDIYQYYLDHPRFDLFKKSTWIVDGYRWCAIPWQHSHGVPDSGAGEYSEVPEHIKHRRPGNHAVLNEFLTQYIQQHCLLDQAKY
jgi:hypothetical protein